MSLPTTLSGSTYSMTNSNASTLKCQNASGNITFTGSDDSWGNGDPTNRETGCVDAFYAAEKERQMLSQWLGRNGMNGSGGWVPTRVGLNDVNAYYDGTQVQIGHTQTGGRWIGSIDVVAHEYGHGIDDKTPGGISRGNTQEFVADTFGAGTEWFADNAVDTPGLHRRGAGQPGRQRSDPLHVPPVARGRRQLLLLVDSEPGGACGRRPRQPLVLPACRGQQPLGRAAHQPDVQRIQRDAASASRRR